MTADNLPRRLLRFVRRNRRRNADWWADEWCREATERDALARRMDAVREWAESMPDAYPESLLAADEEHGARIYARGMCTAAHMVLALLDGDGEAGE